MALVKDRDSEECGTDEEWTKMMDREGLWHVEGDHLCIVFIYRGRNQGMS